MNNQPHWATALAGVLAVTAALATAAPAHATYPGGANGRLAFGLSVDGNTDVYSVRPNGHGLRRLTYDPGFDACPAYTADGDSIAWCGPGGVWVMMQNGTHKRQLTSFGSFPDFSPDGRRVVFNGREPGATAPDIYVINVDGTGLTRLTTDRGFDAFPAWSPDGTTIAFNSNRTGVMQVWLMHADGSDQHQLTIDPAPEDQVPDWRPDGAQIAYLADGAPDSGDIWIINPDGSNPHPITFGLHVFGVAWSPDATKIATADPLTQTLEVMSADGTDLTAIHRGGPTGVPAWQPRGGPGQHHPE